MPLDVVGGPSGAAAAPVDWPANTVEHIFDCDDDECVAEFDKCGGGYNVSSLCCDPQMECVMKNWYFAQCLDEERAGTRGISPLQFYAHAMQTPCHSLCMTFDCCMSAHAFRCIRSVVLCP